MPSEFNPKRGKNTSGWHPLRPRARDASHEDAPTTRIGGPRRCRTSKSREVTRSNTREDGEFVLVLIAIVCGDELNIFRYIGLLISLHTAHDSHAAPDRTSVPVWESRAQKNACWPMLQERCTKQLQAGTENSAAACCTFQPLPLHIICHTRVTPHTEAAARDARTTRSHAN
jgi:hypothetical protein